MSIYDIEVTQSNGNTYPLSNIKGNVLLIINTASHCRFTPQYQALEELHKKYSHQGLMILAFPCNQFANQEPDKGDKIESFCQLNYGVTFELHKKIKVNGPDSTPLYQYLKQQAKGIFGTQSIKWNFTKFLVNHDGSIIERFSPKTDPLKLEDRIKIFLSKR
jgi:glutathione peroxidase